MDMIRDENFEPNLNITSQARSLNLGPSMNVSNGVFFLNTDAASVFFLNTTLALSHTISCFKFRHCLRRSDSFSDHSGATFESGFFQDKWYGKGLNNKLKN